MLRLGEKQTLRIVKKVGFGVYLAESAEAAEKVLLPAAQVPAGKGLGEEVEVFLYRDSEDRLISTTAAPLLTMGETARLRVADVNRYGAFLDWGLEKELFLPFKEQTVRVEPGDMPLVALYLDKSGRLCATMNVYSALSTASPYQKEDRVEGYVYEINPDLGAFVAVDNKYSALIPKKEMYGDIRPGQVVTARVTAVKEDGKLDLSVREKAYLQMEKDSLRILELLESFDGTLPFTDKASPEVIRRETGMSKNEFKRAVGRLLKAGRIEIKESGIRRI